MENEGGELLDGAQQASDAVAAPAAEPISVALSAIDTLLSLSSWVLTILGIVLALIALVGWFTIHNSAVKAARDVAEKRLNEYLEEERFQNMLTEAVERKVTERVAGMLVVSPQARATDDRQVFPPAEKSNG